MVFGLEIIQKLRRLQIALIYLKVVILLPGSASSQSLKLYVESGINHSARSVAFSPDRRFAAAGGIDRTIKVWDVGSSRELVTLANDKAPYYLVFHPTLSIIASYNDDGTITVWDFRAGERINTLDSNDYFNHSSLAFSESGNVLIYANAKLGILMRWDVPSFNELPPLSIHAGYRLTNMRMNTDSTMLAGTDERGVVRILDTRTWKEICKLDGASFSVETIAFVPLSKRLLTASPGVAGIRQWDLTTGREVITRKQLEINLAGIHFITFSSDGDLIACAIEKGDVVIIDSATWKERSRLKSFSNRVENAGLIEDSQKLAVQLWYDTKVVWDLEKGVPVDYDSRSLMSQNIWEQSGNILGQTVSIEKTNDYVRIKDDQNRELCTIVLLDKENSWVVVTPDGRFDTNKDLSDIAGVHWIIPNDSFNPLPLELFMRDYYEPRLLTKALKRQQLLKLGSLADLNRLQPIVKIRNITRARAGSSVRVVIDVASVSGKQSRDRRTVTLKSGVYDLRLFRDGQQVGHIPGKIKLDSSGKATVQRYVKLPRQENLHDFEFTAYAFNSDRVKSATAKYIYKLPQPLPTVKGRAYVISIGVNAYEYKSWDLGFAASDAKTTQDELMKSLTTTGAYSEVISVMLTSDSEERPDQRIITEQLATKQNIRTALNLLAGRPINPSLVKSIPGAKRLRKVEPEDVVLITFSSHGYTDRQGKFYLIPYDSGGEVKYEGAEIAPESLSHFISSDELSEWLKEVDAREIVMVVDTCHSASAVEEPGFKPGPMGSRGMGQLAYDKGMRILAASQADDVALEVAKLRQGLLTYALVREGLEGKKSDSNGDGRITLDEWLKYGEQRVPTLYMDIKTGKVEEIKSKDVRITAVQAGPSVKKNAFQQPSLFDFKKKKREINLAILK